MVPEASVESSSTRKITTHSFIQFLSGQLSPDQFKEYWVHDQCGSWMNRLVREKKLNSKGKNRWTDLLLGWDQEFEEVFNLPPAQQKQWIALRESFFNGVSSDAPSSKKPRL